MWYRFLVYKCVIGPQANFIEMTVPTKLASFRAWTLTPLEEKNDSTNTLRASHLRMETLNKPSARLKMKPKWIRSCNGIPSLFSQLMVRLCKTHILLDYMSQTLTRFTTSDNEEKVIQIREYVNAFGSPIHHKFTDDFWKPPRGCRQTRWKGIILIINFLPIKANKTLWIWVKRHIVISRRKVASNTIIAFFIHVG